MLSLDFGRPSAAGDPRRPGHAATRPIGRTSSVSSLRDYDLPLLWAVLVILTAIQFVGSGPDKDDPAQGDNAAGADGLTNEQRQAIANAF